MEQVMIRINKYLSEAGVCSRRAADQLIEAGKVKVNGLTATIGTKVTSSDKVEVEGKVVRPESKMVLIAVNKPAGIVCTAEKREANNIIDFMNYPIRIYPIGRLDKESQGLILMTNNGDLVNKIMRAGNLHEKEYIVTVNKDVTEEFLEGMRSGVPILDTVTRPCVVEKVGKRKIRMILTQGLNRQIRRMCEYFDYRVIALKRTRIMNIELGDLKIGAYRFLTETENSQLMKELENSSSSPIQYTDEE